MKRYLVLCVAVLFAVTGVLFASGGGESAPGDGGAGSGGGTAAPVSFAFWTTETQSDRMATIQVLIDTYTALNPNVSINLVPVDENDIPTQINAAAAARTLPGLVEMGAENAVTFGAEGYLDKEATLALLNDIGKENFYEGVLRLVSDGSGGYYALPYHGWIQGIWYRADWFEQAGLAPRTTSERVVAGARSPPPTA